MSNAVIGSLAPTRSPSLIATQSALGLAEVDSTDSFARLPLNTIPTSSDHLPARSFSWNLDGTGLPLARRPSAATDPCASKNSRRNPAIDPVATELKRLPLRSTTQEMCPIGN